MSKSDVVVIGNGLAGLMSALVSADQDKKVTLLSYGAGTFPLNSGVIDIMGYDDSGKAVANPAQAVAAVADEHPYKKIGLNTVEEAVKFFQEVVAAEGFPYVGSLNEQQWLVTGVGTLKPSCLVPESMQGSKCFEASEIVLVGVKGLKDYYVDMVAENLAKELGNDKKYTVITVDPHYKGARDLTTKDVAAWMDTDAGYADFVSQVKGNAGAGKVFVVPQILGMKGNIVYKKIVAELGCPVVETTAMPPSVNGLRLRDVLLSALKKKGITVIENSKAEEAVYDGSKVVAVKAGGEVRLQTYYADKFIVATGGFYSGGITMRDFGDAKEVVFGLPIEIDCVEERWVNKQLFSDKKQTFAKTGVRVDTTLRGVDESGNVVLENVYVAGRNLSGYDFCFEHSGNGVALASAYKAAKA
ncbi:MAG: anaerobic glycerol-3-phosphate dehydrogenase subunit B [Anaerovibrio sp.]|uniref:anaerobic glycerol-3-phosphate dehydrogenase subunit GlpB n=1 Tax=Anaerovibrio sp. TaxID=1872532 RepID=UPI0025E3DF80|nr:anaerobic glycerol-3-phosphate dehydrogenase subunit GlpB [Anaerovibrio sp.]MCR5175427.1 anaerobic glycerol-3-phosphate dehydrogenase subunit B [Anaerovibrio sp.]